MRKQRTLIDEMLAVDAGIWKKRRDQMLTEVTRIEQALGLWPLSVQLEGLCKLKKRPAGPSNHEGEPPYNAVFWMRRRSNYLAEIDNIERMLQQKPRLATLRQQWNNGGG